MFNIFKKENPIFLFQGMTDVHTHLLPGVDDGVKDYDLLIQLVRYMMQIGVKQVIVTPHISEYFPQNNASELRQQFDLLNAGNQSNITFRLAAEYRIDSRAHLHLQDGL